MLTDISIVYAPQLLECKKCTAQWIGLTRTLIKCIILIKILNTIEYSQTYVLINIT